MAEIYRFKCRERKKIWHYVKLTKYNRRRKKNNLVEIYFFCMTNKNQIKFDIKLACFILLQI